MGGKHSARAMQLATKIYKDGGGKYEGKKPDAKSNKMHGWVVSTLVPAAREVGNQVKMVRTAPRR